MGVGVIGMDGGIGSTINLHVADDCTRRRCWPPPAGSPHSGARPWGLFADTESLAAFGSNPPDPRCRIASAQGGRARGRRRVPRRRVRWAFAADHRNERPGNMIRTPMQGAATAGTGPAASEDLGVFRQEPQRSIGEAVDLLDPETGGLDRGGSVAVGVTTRARTRPHRGDGCMTRRPPSGGAGPTAPLGTGVGNANSAVTGDHCPYSEAKMPCMVVISCW